MRSQSRRYQSGLNLVSILGVLLLLILMVGVVYLFLPVDETSSLNPSQSSHQSDDKTPKAEFSRAELQQLQPVEGADPELQNIAREIANNRTAQEGVENQGAQENGSETVGSVTSEITPSQATSTEMPVGSNNLKSVGREEKEGLNSSVDSIKSSVEESQLTNNSQVITAGVANLTGSDTKVRESIQKIDSSNTMLSWLVGDELIRHFVVLVDNMANGAIPSKQMIFKSPQGSLVVQELGEDYILLAENYVRYQSYTKLLSGLPPETVIRYYQQFYPLLQQAYMELGYPNRSFHHRLLEAIEVVLNAPMPNPGEEIVLKQPSVMYTYADESLQRSADINKLLLRMGPENAGLFKESLWQWKRLLIQLDHR